MPYVIALLAAFFWFTVPAAANFCEGGVVNPAVPYSCTRYIPPPNLDPRDVDCTRDVQADACVDDGGPDDDQDN